MNKTEWVTPVGTRGTREDFKALYGGSTNPGIVTPANSKFILVFSDAVAAAYYGYGLDGWSADGTFFRYTGSGAYDDQELTRGNRAINESPSSGRELHLFIAVGTVQNSGTKIHEYIGQFELDPEEPHVIQNQPNARKQLRKTYVFNLFPVGTVSKVGHRQATDDFDQDFAAVESIPLEAGDSLTFTRSAVTETVAERREFSLSERFSNYLLAQGREVGRLRIYPPGSRKALFTDIVDFSSNVLYEAKAASGRGHIREALGQLLDYSRYLENEMRQYF